MSESVPASSVRPNRRRAARLASGEAQFTISAEKRQSLAKNKVTQGEPLGKPGAYGAVFAATDELRRNLAVKIVKNPNDRTVRKRHQRECQVLDSSQIPAELETKLKTETTARAAVQEKLVVAERDAKRVPALQAALEAAEREESQAAVELATRPASNGSLSPTTFTRPGVGTKAGGLLTLEVKGVPVRYRWCPPGTFRMGSPETEFGRYNDENPVTVTLTQGYWIMETECWQKLWEVVMGSSKDWDRGRSDQHPAYYVSHEEAVEFAKKFETTLLQAGIAMNGWSISRPTEAQWEYAIRGGTTTAYCFGDNASQLGDYAWHTENSGGTTHPVGTKKPHPWGIRDGHGSLWEWTNDVWADKQSGGTNPKGPTSGSYRVYRGGCWDGSPRGCRSAIRFGFSPGNRDLDLGCRLTLVPVAGS
jgi:formylglycine-generating enzyme required for sulfatase activity